MPKPDQGVGEGQDVGGDRTPFGLVGVQGPGGARERDGQLPAQVVGVRDAGVHALPAGRGMGVRGVARQEDPSAPVGVGRAPLAPEGG